MDREIIQSRILMERDPHPDRKLALGIPNGLLRGSDEAARR
jgi:hypothetical protein